MSDSEGSSPFDLSHELVPTRDHIPAGRITTTTLDGLLTSSSLNLIEDLTTGCGGQLWPAGIRLAKYVIRRYAKEGLRSKRIVELGSGGGVTGLAIALEIPDVGQDGGEMWMTDIEGMVELMEKNVKLNALDGKLKVGLLDWADDIPDYIKRPVDIILAADCVYFEPAMPLLEKTLYNLAGPETEILFCFKKRRKADIRFVKSLRKKFEFVELQDEDTPSTSRESIFLYSLRKKPLQA